MVVPRVHDLERHLSDIHGVFDPDIRYLSANAPKVRKNAPKTPTFTPITTAELTNAFTRGLAMHNAIIAKALLSHEKASAKDSPAPSGPKGHRRKRRMESVECIAPRHLSCSLEGDSQRPHEKRQKMEAPAECASGASDSMLVVSASSQLYQATKSAGFNVIPRKRKQEGCRGAARRHA